jgi:hypothetical protein
MGEYVTPECRIFDGSLASSIICDTLYEQEKRNLKEYQKALLLLRRVYNCIEMEHLNSDQEEYDIYFPKSLGQDIFNYLSAKSQTFRETAIKRQKRFRRRQKAIRRSNCDCK